MINFFHALLAIGCGVIAYYSLLLIANLLTHFVVFIERFYVSK